MRRRQHFSECRAIRKLLGASNTAVLKNLDDLDVVRLSVSTDAFQLPSEAVARNLTLSRNSQGVSGARKGKTMLVKIENGGPVAVTKQAHAWWFRQWKRLLDPADFQRIKDALNHHINTVGGSEIITSSWIPGANWDGTPYEPIWEAVMGWNLARFFFGLIVWNVVMNRPERWSFGRYPKKIGDIIGLTYFRVR
jgi:hypothetical protein